MSGGSRGIGAAIAGTLANRGIAVAVNYFRSPDRAAAVVRDIQASGGTAYAVQADVRDPAAVARMVE